MIQAIKNAARKVPVVRAGYHALTHLRRDAYRLVKCIYYAISRATPPPSYYLRYVRTSNPVARPGRVSGTKVSLRTNPDGSRDFSLYNEQNFLDVPRFENFDYLHGRVRKEDMGCAALYAFGITSFKEAQRIFPETTFEDQVSAVLGVAARHPKYVADIGCGLGSLAALLIATGVRVDAVDPSPVSREKVYETVTKFNRKSLGDLNGQFRFFSLQAGEYMEAVANAASFPDTFIFVESVEHIPDLEMVRFVEVLRTRGNCSLIITSAVDFHPITPDGTGWNHITLIDDVYYERLSGLAKKRILRAGSHLVLKF
jgi:SAM-dependent methyltransferase